ncbi:hypothetical protein [Fibrella aquatica]|uniref:hypothetical protein n=1 Tax=Fibrella aquatica TaxID=3242487 RepID=UPI003522FBD4
MSEKVSNDLFDLKNDPRLSVYLYRAGFGCWLLYLLAGAPIMASLRFYRTDLGILSFFMMVAGLSASMVYDYYHNAVLFTQKKKWLAIGYTLLAALIYFVVLGNKSPVIPNWLSF